MFVLSNLSGKTAWSRGVHLNYTGLTPDGLEALTHELFFADAFVSLESAAVPAWSVENYRIRRIKA
jgi:hypothetical protein